MLGPNWGCNSGLPDPSHQPHLHHTVPLAQEAIGFSLQGWKTPGGPREEARPHSLRHPGAPWNWRSQSYQEVVEIGPKGLQRRWKGPELQGMVPCTTANIRYPSNWLKPPLPVKPLPAPSQSRMLLALPRLLPGPWILQCKNLPKSLISPLSCSGAFSPLSNCSVKGVLRQSFNSSAVSSFLPSPALPSFPLPFPLGLPQGLTLPRASGLGLHDPQGPPPESSVSPWPLPTASPHPHLSHPRFTKTKIWGIKSTLYCPRLISMTYITEIETFSEKVKKTLQSPLGVAKACVLAPHWASHWPRAGKPPALLLFKMSPCFRARGPGQGTSWLTVRNWKGVHWPF